MLCNVIICAVVLTFTGQLTIWWWGQKVLIYQFLVSPRRTLKKWGGGNYSLYFVKRKGSTIRVKDCHFPFLAGSWGGTLVVCRLLVPQTGIKAWSPCSGSADLSPLDHQEFPKGSLFQGSWQLYADIHRCMFLILIFT